MSVFILSRNKVYKQTPEFPSWCIFLQVLTGAKHNFYCDWKRSSSWKIDNNRVRSVYIKKDMTLKYKYVNALLICSKSTYIWVHFCHLPSLQFVSWPTRTDFANPHDDVRLHFLSSFLDAYTSIHPPNPTPCWPPPIYLDKKRWLFYFPM